MYWKINILLYVLTIFLHVQRINTAATIPIFNWTIARWPVYASSAPFKFWSTTADSDTTPSATKRFTTTPVQPVTSTSARQGASAFTAPRTSLRTTQAKSQHSKFKRFLSSPRQVTGFPWEIPPETLIVSDSLFQWSITDEQLEWVFSVYPYIKHQYDKLRSSGADRLVYTECTGCKFVRENNAFQIGFNPQNASDLRMSMCSADFCVQSPQYKDIAYKGCYNYDYMNQLTIAKRGAENLLYIAVLHTQHKSEIFKTCAMMMQTMNCKYLLVQRSSVGWMECYCTNETNALRYGISTTCQTIEPSEQSTFNYLREGVNGSVAFYMLTNCPNVQGGWNGNCYKPMHHKTLDEARTSCGSSPITSVNQLAPYLDHTRNGWVEKTLFIRTQNEYSCVHYDPINNTISTIICSNDQRETSFCSEIDAEQETWTSWSSTTSCTEVCSNNSVNGTRIRKQFRFSTTYLQPEENESIELCYTEVNCSSYDFTPQGIKWAGCWSSLRSPMIYMEGSIDDGLAKYRIKPIEKCRVASPGSEYIAIQGDKCYASSVNFSYRSNGASLECSKHGVQDGDGFELFSLKDDKVLTNYGPWSDYGSCSRACNGGIQTSYKHCINPPLINQVSKVGNCYNTTLQQTQNCNTAPCPENLRYSKIGCFVNGSYRSRSIKVEESKITQYPVGYPDTPDTSSYLIKDGLRKCALKALQDGYGIFAYYGQGNCVLDADLECGHANFTFAETCDSDLETGTTFKIYTFNHHESLCATIPSDVILEQEIDSLLHSDNITRDDFIEALELISAANQADTEESVPNLTNRVFEQLATKVHMNPTEEHTNLVIEKLVETLDSLQKSDSPQNWNDGAFEELITATEEILKALLSRRTSSSNITIGDPDTGTALYVVRLNTDMSNDEPVQLKLGTSVLAVDLPNSLLESAHGSDVSVAMITYSTATQFIGTPKMDLKLSERIASNDSNTETTRLEMSDRLISLKINNGQQASTLGGGSIGLVIPTDTSSIDNHTYDDLTRICVFYNFTTKSWSDYGCTTNDHSGQPVICECNHTTSFAVLMKFTDYKHSQLNERALTIITYIGVTISLLCLLACFIIFIYLDNLKTERKKIHMNLIVALGLAQITHIVGIDLTYDRTTCTVIAAFLHYFWTATFCWMLCEGIHLYHKIISVFNSEGLKKRIMYYIIGWGTPVVIVSTSLAIRKDGFGTEKHCWLSTDQGLVWAFMGPVCFISLVNFIIMGVVVRIVIKSATSMTQEERKVRETVKAGVKSVIILTPILGMNWLFGLFAVDGRFLVLEFLFVIINSLQGLLIFIFHCVGSSEVRSAIQWKRDKWSRSKSLGENSTTNNNKPEVKADFRLKSKNILFNKIKPGRRYPKLSASITATPNDNNNIIVGLIEGTYGGNLGGLKHIVTTPTSDSDFYHRGMSRDESVTPDSAKAWICDNPSFLPSPESAKNSVSTTITSLSDFNLPRIRSAGNHTSRSQSQTSTNQNTTSHQNDIGRLEDLEGDDDVL